MPMYEVEWTEVVKHKARVLIPSNDKALLGAIPREVARPPIIDWIEKDKNPVVSNGPTEVTVTALGRVMPDGEIKPL